jgi:hypothetical protein
MKNSSLKIILIIFFIIISNCTKESKIQKTFMNGINLVTPSIVQETQQTSPCLGKRSKKLLLIFNLTLGFAGVDRFYAGWYLGGGKNLQVNSSYKNFCKL